MPSSQDEQEHLALVDTFEPYHRYVRDRRTVAGAEDLALDLHLAARHLHPRVPAGQKGMFRGFTAIEEPGVEARVGVDGDASVLTIGRSHEAQAALLLGA